MPRRRIAAVDHDVGGACQLDQPVTAARAVRVQHRAALVGVVQCERNAGARHAGWRVARRAAGGRFDFQHVGTEVGEEPADGVGFGAAEIEHPKRVEQSVAHWASSRSTHSSWASVPVTAYMKSTKASG